MVTAVIMTTLVVVVTMVMGVGMIVVAYNCGYIGSGNHGDGDIGYQLSHMVGGNHTDVVVVAVMVMLVPAAMCSCVGGFC